MRVYSSHELASPHQHVPTLTDQSRAQSLLREHVTTLVENGQVVGGIVFGSGALRRQTRTSDLDFGAIIADEAGYSALSDVIGLVRRETRVKVQPIIVLQQLAREGLHDMEDPLLAHMERLGNENILGTNILGIDPTTQEPYIRRHHGAPQAVFEGYMAHRLNRIGAGATTADADEKRKALENVFELTSHGPRRLFEALGSSGFPALLTNDDSSQTVAEAMNVFATNIHLPFPNERAQIKLIHDQLVGAKKDYQAILAATLLVTEDPDATTSARRRALRSYDRFLLEAQGKWIQVGLTFAQMLMTYGHNALQATG